MGDQYILLIFNLSPIKIYKDPYRDPIALWHYVSLRGRDPAYHALPTDPAEPEPDPERPGCADGPWIPEATLPGAEERRGLELYHHIGL